MNYKAMLFIDGGWMYFNKKNILAFNEDFDSDLDYSQIPSLVAEQLQEQAGEEVKIMRNFYFASIPVNKPNFNPCRQQAFYNYLSEECHFDTRIYETDYRNDPNYKCNNKSNEIGLATKALTQAFIPDNFDIAVILTGDISFAPLIKSLRAMGKKVMLVSSRILPECGQLPNFSKFDYPVIYLEEHWEKLKLVRDEIERKCYSCNNIELTNWHGSEFYCRECRLGNQQLSLRECNSCGKEEETSWDETYFYCFDCRESHRKKQARTVSAV